MKLITTSAIALAAALAAAPAAGQGNYGAQAPQQPQTTAAQGEAPAQPQQRQIKLSGKAGKAIMELQRAVNANDVANIPARLAAAQALASTADDRFAIGQLQLKAAVAAKNNEAAAQAVDYIAASNFLPKAQLAGLYNSVGVEFFNAKNPARAVAMFEKSVAIDPNNTESLRLLAEAQNASATPAQAIATFKRALQQAAATGQKLPEDSYKRAVSVAYSAKAADAPEIARQWVAAYPTPESWKNAVAIYRNLNRPGVGQTLDLLRLMRAAGALISPGDYSLYATAAADQGNFAEAQSVIDQGLKAKVVDPANPNFRDIIAGLKAKPKATAADLAAAVKMAPSASSLIGIGDRYFGLGDYAKAIETYKAAMAKGADKDLANLHIGMALARSGDKAGATAALSAVGGAHSEVAKYWLLYVQKMG